MDAPEVFGPNQVLLQLAPFPRGDYLVELSAEIGGRISSAERLKSSSELVAFRIQP